MIADFTSAIAELRRAADRLAELVIWKEMDDEYSRPGLPPAFRIGHHFDEDATAFYGQFLHLDQLLHTALARPDMAWDWEAKMHWRKALVEIEERVRRLRISETFIRR
jgi:hypothetical protein